MYPLIQIITPEARPFIKFYNGLICNGILLPAVHPYMLSTGQIQLDPIEAKTIRIEVKQKENIKYFQQE